MTTHVQQLYLSPGKVGANAACSYWSNRGSVHHVPIMAGWTKAVWNTKFAWHFYTWSALGIKPQTFWSWVQCPIHWATRSIYGLGGLYSNYEHCTFALLSFFAIIRKKYVANKLSSVKTILDSGEMIQKTWSLSGPPCSHFQYFLASLFYAFIYSFSLFVFSPSFFCFSLS